MITTNHAPPPTFQDAADNAIELLEATYAYLNQKSAGAANSRDEGRLLYLSSLAQLAACRGCHFGGDKIGIQPAEPDGSLFDQLVDTHERLVEQLPSLASFAVLEFVNDIGSLCRGMRRYVQHD